MTIGFNGPSKELGPDEALISKNGESAIVYCEQCGTVFVYAVGRDCPSCRIAEYLGVPDKNQPDIENTKLPAFNEVNDGERDSG